MLASTKPHDLNTRPDNVNIRIDDDSPITPWTYLSGYNFVDDDDDFDWLPGHA